MAYWSVAQTHPFSENKAQRFLALQGFESYCPRCVVQHGRNPRQKRKVAMFANYLFVRIIDRWHDVQYTVGISHLLKGSKNIPVFVHDKIIDELRSKENEKGFIELPKKEEYHKGQKVRVLSGRFAGYLALYDGMTSRQRECVLLDMLGRRVPVELSIGSTIEAVH